MTHHVPKPLRTDGSNAFARRALGERLPNIVREIQALNPDLSPIIHHALNELHRQIIGNEPIPMLEAPAPDYAEWALAYSQHQGARWLDSEWFFAETMFFRQVIQAVRYYELRKDPYGPMKSAEMDPVKLRPVLDRALQVSGSPQEHLGDVLVRAMWGNQADLSHPESLAAAAQAASGEILVDHRFDVINRLFANEGPVHIIVDNAGQELLMDMVLADRLLVLNMPVVLHLKFHPTYVSDATLDDVWGMIDRFSSGDYGELAQHMGQRLRFFFDRGQLRLLPDPYWNSSRFLSDLPQRFQDVFAKARLVVLKGDANYRRAVYDTVFPVNTRFDEIVAYFPGPLVAMRILKSDPVLGVSLEKAAELDQTDPNWRLRGYYGVIQYKA